MIPSYRNLHPIVKWAIGIAFVEFFLAPLGTEFYDAYLEGPIKTLKTFLASFGFLPHGILIGASLGMVLSLYLLRGNSPDWYKNFDIRLARFDHEAISIQTLFRNYIKKDGKYEFIRSKQFYNCSFHGPGMVLFMDDTSIGPGNTWDRMGTPLVLGDGESVTGCIGFQGCHFEGCTFFHITPIIPEQNYERFLNTFPPEQRHVLKPSSGILAQTPPTIEVATSSDRAASRPYE